MDEKIKHFFSLYDSENKGWISKAEFRKMLLNYPVEDVLKITQEFNEEYGVMRHLDNIESEANIGRNINKGSMDSIDSSRMSKASGSQREIGSINIVISHPIKNPQAMKLKRSLKRKNSAEPEPVNKFFTGISS